MCSFSRPSLYHSCILARDFGHGSVAVTARGLEAVSLLRNVQKTQSSTFPVYRQLFPAWALPRFSKQTRIWPAAGQVQTIMSLCSSLLFSRSLSQSDWQSAVPQGGRREIPFVGGSPHIKDLNQSHVNLSHHSLQHLRVHKVSKLFPGIWPQTAKPEQGWKDLSHTVFVITTELMAEVLILSPGFH